MEEKIRLPEEWAGWEVTEELGAGSYGRVYEARKRNLSAEGGAEEKAAVKIIRIPADDAEAAVLAYELPKEEDRARYYENVVDGLLAEIHAMEALKENPNAVHLQDSCVEHEEGSFLWTIYIRMELLIPLGEYRVEHELREPEVIRLGLDLCHVLEECEKRAILHRDIKTENIMVSGDGVFKLGDFGLARQLRLTTGSLSLKGSFTYMSPEVYHGEAYDTRADQYSLGIVLYRLMNRNRDPFTDPDAGMIYYKDRESSLQKRMKGEKLPPPADASERTAAVILKACAYSPKERYRHIADLKHDLMLLAGEGTDAVLIAERGEAAEEEKPEEARPRRKRIPVLVAAAAVVALFLIAGAAFGLFGKKTPSGSAAESGRDAESGQETAAQAETGSAGETESITESETTQASTEALAGSGTCGNDLRWELTESGVLTIRGTGMMTAYQVLHAAPWRFLNVEEVFVEEGVTGIGSYAFRMNASIREVHLPQSLEYIGDGAFEQCWVLTSLSIPAAVDHVGIEVFAGCVNLTSVTVAKDNPVFDSRNYCNAVIETAANTVVAGCRASTIPDGVEAIGPSAFDTCIGLTEITIPDSVTRIDETAFLDCDEELVICGSAGSAAETYAKSAGFKFREISK